MWIRDVDFADSLLEAHRSGGLVLFVGAGASRDAPSGLPDFRTLTLTIASEAQVSATKADLDRPEVLLGRLKDKDVDIHKRVAAHIGVTGSKPNRLHRAVVDLAVAAPAVRIVTTNYDLHLSTAARDQSVTLDEFAGPALPMGDDFEGLVYLHGWLKQEPRRLVVTDRDFGDAYLRSAWAARFLERMFSEYTVLFIGYSHNDVVMRFLARALGPGHQRYVLTDRPDDPDWRELGINSIGYKVVAGSHAALADAVEGWTALATMGLLDHRQRLAQLTAVPPSKVPEEESYLEASLAEIDRVKLSTTLEL